MNSVEIEKLKDDIYTCNRTRCGFCREECPIYEIFRFEAFSSRGRNQIARGLLEGSIKPSQDLLEYLSFCCVCGYCKYRCALENMDLVEMLRADLIKAGFEIKTHRRLKEKILKNRNPQGKSLEQKCQWAEDLKFNENGKQLFFAGCVYSFLNPAILVKMVKILQGAGIDLNYFRDEDCCGGVMRLTGYWDDFRAHSKSSIELFKERGIEEIITPCPSCYKTFKQTYSQFNPDFNLKISHIIQIILDLIDKKKLILAKKIEKRVTWHDPCDLGRFMGMFEEPRKIINSIPGIELVEMENNRYESKCCGGGGGMLAENADIAIEIATKRIAEAEKTKAEYLVTMCPTCEDVLSRAARYSESSIEVIDLFDLLEMAL